MAVARRAPDPIYVNLERVDFRVWGGRFQFGVEILDSSSRDWKVPFCFVGEDFPVLKKKVELNGPEVSVDLIHLIWTSL